MMIRNPVADFQIKYCSGNILYIGNGASSTEVFSKTRMNYCHENRFWIMFLNVMAAIEIIYLMLCHK